MPYLRHRVSGAVTDFLSNDSVEYQTLRGMKLTADATAASGPATSGLISGETSGTLKAGSPMWEEIAEEDVGLPDPPGGHVAVLSVGSAATAAAETTSDTKNVKVSGTITDAEYVPSASIAGQATNNRVITLNEVVITGTASPARAVTPKAAVTFGAGVNGVANQGTPMTVSDNTLTQGGELQVASTVNGTGLPDPGGVVFVVYTRS